VPGTATFQASGALPDGSCALDLPGVE